MPTQCHVVNCSKPAVAKGLCDAHRKRVARHGSVNTMLRPEDWGDRRKHPAYPAWKGLRRAWQREVPQNWLDDFWNFAKEVPEKPEGVHATAARDETKPWSPENFYWKTSRTTTAHKEDRRAYMREWQRSIRAADPDYGKNAFLKKRYGVTLEWYEAKHIEQNGLCAICLNPETTIINGRLLTLAVDHCHDEGHVRGLLCSKCNQGLGCFKNNPTFLQAAIRYLCAEVSQEPSAPAP